MRTWSCIACKHWDQLSLSVYRAIGAWQWLVLWWVCWQYAVFWSNSKSYAYCQASISRYTPRDSQSQLVTAYVTQQTCIFNYGLVNTFTKSFLNEKKIKDRWVIINLTQNLFDTQPVAANCPISLFKTDEVRHSIFWVFNSIDF